MAQKSSQEIIDQANANIAHNKKIMAELDKSVENYQEVLKGFGLDDEKVEQLLAAAPKKLIEEAQKNAEKEIAPFLETTMDEQAKKNKREISRKSKVKRHGRKV